MISYPFFNIQQAVPLLLLLLFITQVRHIKYVLYVQVSIANNLLLLMPNAFQEGYNEQN